MRIVKTAVEDPLPSHVGLGDRFLVSPQMMEAADGHFNFRMLVTVPGVDHTELTSDFVVELLEFKELAALQPMAGPASQIVSVKKVAYSTGRYFTQVFSATIENPGTFAFLAYTADNALVSTRVVLTAI